ncbi:hypothetical protein HFM99_07115 [Lacrimispora celerecrescens]|nr:hypothetical protein [Lacrimispora celerecrescens]
MEENKLHYHMKVRVFRKEGAFGPGVAELMHHVLIVVYANCDMYSPVYMGS